MSIDAAPPQPSHDTLSSTGDVCLPPEAAELDNVGPPAPAPDGCSGDVSVAIEPDKPGVEGSWDDEEHQSH